MADEGQAQKVSQKQLKKNLEKERNKGRIGPAEEVEGGNTIDQSATIKQGAEPPEFETSPQQKAKAAVGMESEDYYKRLERQRAKHREKEGNLREQAQGIKNVASKISSEEEQKSEQNGLKLYPFPMLFLAIALDIIDFISGFLDETLITMILRIVLEFIVSASIWVMLIPQTKKGDRDQAKYILSAIIDAIPILTFLPWETVVLYLINRKKEGKGGLVQKATQKLETQTT